MITPVIICNMALRHIDNAPIVSFNDRSPQGINANLAWPIAYKEFLSGFPWTFATRWGNIFQVNNTEVWGFKYCHQLPADFERLIDIRGFSPEESFEITNLNGVRVLACNSTPVSIKYMSNDFSLDNMSSPALYALMFRVALHLDQMLNLGTSMQLLGSLYEEQRNEAIKFEGTAKNKNMMHPGSLNLMRFGDFVEPTRIPRNG